MPHFTPYLVMVLVGFGAFMCALAFASLYGRADDRDRS